MRMQVKRDEKSNRYCGPAALSLLTGEHVDKCVIALRDVRRARRPGKRVAIRGVHNVEMLRALRDFGFHYNALHVQLDYPIKHKSKGAAYYPTLVKFLQWKRDRTPDQRFLLSTGHHYVVLRGNKIYDNYHPAGVFIRQYEHRRVRVRSAWEVSPNPLNGHPDVFFINSRIADFSTLS